METVRKTNKTENKHKSRTRQLFNFGRDSYLERTSRPIYAIFFLLPFLIFHYMCQYFLDSNVLNQLQVRIVALVWLQKLLELIGFDDKSAWLTPPLVVLVILITMQITSGKQWRFWIGDILPMAVECILLAVPLVILTLFIGSSARVQDSGGPFDDRVIRTQDRLPSSRSSMADKSLVSLTDRGGRDEKSGTLMPSIVTGMDAGIYEELVFRLALICVLMMLFQDLLRLSHEKSILLSVLISAALFSTYHHIVIFSGQSNALEPFNLTSFAFRTMAGIYFAVLFAIRGFGITAGTHVSYNIIEVLLSCEAWIIPLACGH
jgi:hypothetical protein